MICKACALAADLLTFYYDNPVKRMGATQMAGSLHGDCRGETSCDCQHSLNVFRGISGD